eukprot:UN00735
MKHNVVLYILVLLLVLAIPSTINTQYIDLVMLTAKSD